jgi:hypothetical protein
MNDATFQPPGVSSSSLPPEQAHYDDLQTPSPTHLGNKRKRFCSPQKWTVLLALTVVVICAAIVLVIHFSSKEGGGLEYEENTPTPSPSSGGQ